MDDQLQSIALRARRMQIKAPRTIPLPRAKPLHIRTATQTDLEFIAALQRQYSNQVGFLPRPAIADYITAGNVLIAQIGRDRVGYLIGKLQLAWQNQLAAIFQVAVTHTHHRKGIALQLITAHETTAIAIKKVGIQANCATDLPANEFWRAAGYVAICHMEPDNARRRPVICWRKPFTRKIPLWFASPPKRAGHQAKTTRSPRDRNRKTDRT